MLRLAGEPDRERLAVLAQLDAGPIPAGPTLVAVVDGDLVAALPLEGGRPIADPFRRTEAILELLALRAADLTRAPARRAHGRFARLRPRLT